jgi:hypothetical protein
MACEEERALVNDLLERYRDAQSDCNAGVHSACGLANNLLHQLIAARAALQSCLNPAPPISNLAIVGIERTQAIQFFLSNG